MDKIKLENLLIEQPNKKDNWLIYGDWLLTQSNALGEVINYYCTKKIPVNSQQFNLLPLILQKPFAQFMQVLLDNRYVDHQDGTITDLATGLMWMRCYLGQSWDGKTCIGDAAHISWNEASKKYGRGREIKEQSQFDPSRGGNSLNYYQQYQKDLLEGYYSGTETIDFAGYNNWRLPVVEEGSTLLTQTENKPGCYYDLGVFFPAQIHATRDSWQYCGWLWSASPLIRSTYSAWYINFNRGYDEVGYRISNRHIRLVRNKQ